MIGTGFLPTYKVSVEIPGSTLVVELPASDTKFLYEEAKKRFESLKKGESNASQKP